MRTILFFVFVSVQGMSSSQIKDSELIHSMNLMYGSKTFKVDFSSDFNNFADINLTHAYKLAGTGFSGELLISGYYTATCAMHFMKIIPENIAVNDSTNYKIAGHHFGFTLFGFDVFHRSENVDLVFAGGFDSGRIKLIHPEGIKIRNGMFAPKLSLLNRFKLGSCAIGWNLDYAFDISKPSWKRNDTSISIATPLNGFKQSGINASIIFGFIF